VKKRGKIKFFDPEQGYGYILREEADDPAQTIPFEAKDVTTEIEELVPGTEVVFEIDETGGAAQARKVERVEVA
jgi:cold shock CspA family protein